MKKISQMKLSAKLVIYIAMAILIVYVAIFGFVAMNMGPILIGGVEKIADNNVAKYANLCKSYLSEDMQISRTLADGYETYLPYSPKEKLRRTIDILQRVYSKHPYFSAIYTSWERKYVDYNWNKSYGRIRVSLFSPPKNDGDTKNYSLDTLNTYGDDVNSSYYKCKIQQKNILSDPYDNFYSGVKETVVSVLNPLVKDGRFLGSTGIDIPISRFAKLIDSADKFYSSSIFLLSNNGMFVGSQVKDLIGKNISDVIKVDGVDVLAKIKKGKSFSMSVTHTDNKDYYVTFYPFTVADVTTPWMVGIAIPRSEMSSVMITKVKFLLIVNVFGLIIIILIIYFLIKGVTAPLTYITNMLKLLSSGEINKVEEIDIKRDDEIGEIIDSTNILVENLKRTATFADEIGKGSLDADFKSISKNDVLGNSLLNMRSSLHKAKTEEQKRRNEEEKQNWATVGYAKFGELLRNSTDNMETFTYNVISSLVKYTNSNQGAMFLLNIEDENDPYLIMSSCYAYDRKKYVDKRIEIGSDLVGQCYLEGESIYMTDIPDDYISITSGLGDANPNTLLLVPLKFNDKVYGVIELASFNTYESYQLEFVEKLAESIASTISTVRVNLTTVQLLEESKFKSEELAAQEEELRQNMEELQTTQEEMLRSKQIAENAIYNLENIKNPIIAMDTELNISYINKAGLEFSATTKEEALKSKCYDLFRNNHCKTSDCRCTMAMSSGKEETAKTKVASSGKEILYTGSPVFNNNGEIIGVVEEIINFSKIINNID